MLTWYEFFFSRGAPSVLHSALQLMTGSTRKRIPLSELVTLLVRRDRSPQSILDWTDRATRLRKAKNKRGEYNSDKDWGKVPNEETR
jgi:hypothetical protein